MFFAGPKGRAKAAQKLTRQQEPVQRATSNFRRGTANERIIALSDQSAPVEARCGFWLDRIGARILRLLHLCDGRLAGLSADLLSVAEPDCRDHRLACDVWRRLCRPPDRRLRARALWRHPWTTKRAAPVHVRDGSLHHGSRRAADLSTGRNLGADPARG